jgi:hypothetical protein
LRAFATAVRSDAIRTVRAFFDEGKEKKRRGVASALPLFPHFGKSHRIVNILKKWIFRPAGKLCSLDDSDVDCAKSNSNLVEAEVYRVPGRSDADAPTRGGVGFGCFDFSAGRGCGVKGGVEPPHSICVLPDSASRLVRKSLA